AGRRARTLTRPATDDQQVLEDHTGGRQANRLPLRIATEIASKIDPALITERGDDSTGSCIEGIEELIDGDEHAGIVAVAPIGHAAIGTSALDTRVERPFEGTGRRVKRNRTMPRRRRVHHTVHADGLPLHFAG